MEIDPENLLNFRLWRLVSLAGAPVTRLCEGRYGITRREWHLLLLLFRDSSLSPSELAERASLDRARVSKAVGGLIEKALVQRNPGRDDRCRIILALTEKGVTLVRDLFPQVEAINARVLSSIPPAAQDAFFSALDAMTRQANEIAREAGVDVRIDRYRGGRKRLWEGNDFPD
ncbi:MarR family transcriptional regulator [Cupriavidus basilensis]|uniref:MarR family transcriptional regulator n=1 Tax=Cupriavidus basilensis TaxID=68895 RepID=A0ABT6ANK8_9BURK|nr:MarR family transcriptional regulator [Cupriavidus basilensis]MDF3834209.1 MarR family transcriptional regulator [Cupriavidus basilensis]